MSAPLRIGSFKIYEEDESALTIGPTVFFTGLLFLPGPWWIYFLGGGLISLGLYYSDTNRMTRNQRKADELIAKQDAELLRMELELEQTEQGYRDAKSDWISVDYRVGRHALETLAIRYGIAHRGNVIEVIKTEWISQSKFKAVLPEYRNREVVIIHEYGTDFIKTFYPPSDAWFDEQKELELVLKGNSGFSIRDMAKFHVDKVVPNFSRK